MNNRRVRSRILRHAPHRYAKLARMSIASNHVKKDVALTSLNTPEFAALMQSKDATIQTLEGRVVALQQQIDWFKRQIFGSKSERFTTEPNPQQLHLGETLAAAIDPTAERRTV